MSRSIAAVSTPKSIHTKEWEAVFGLVINTIIRVFVFSVTIVDAKV